MEDKNNVLALNLEEMMGDRFGKYAKYIIQDRALPDVRDGLKPVQRRILYAMYTSGNTVNNAYRKSAKTVGNVIGNYHPHGDTSVYDAMVRMSQWWKQSVPLIDMQGNNGSLDDDPAAAMRYTEARLAKISEELLKDINKETVEMALNFDDTEEEPTVLPAKFPNILINGAKGIAAGYATNIPPHNFNEILEGTIYRIKHPKCSLEDMMEIIKGPDFPTGATIRGKQGIIDAFNNGSGSIQIVSKYEITKYKGTTSLVITEIPFEVIKSEMVAEIDKIRVNKEVDGIIEVRDESDRHGLRIVVDMKNEANHDYIVNYLLKKTQLSVRYSYNMVTICNRKPLQLGLLSILDYYIAHQVDVITRRSKFDLEKSKARVHILDGLITAKNNIEEVVKIIQNSHDKASSKENLIKRFNFSEKQAEAIVMLHLYRLSSTEILTLENERKELIEFIKELELILSDPNELKKVLIGELKEINKNYVIPRKSQIVDDVLEVNLEKAPIIKEDTYISITRDGYFKRSSTKSYLANENVIPACKEGDIILSISKASTTDVILAFTNSGKFLYIPVFDLTENKWKDEGKHISSIVSLNGEEKIISALLVSEFKDGVYVDLCSKQGRIKRCEIKDFILNRYSKPVSCMPIDNDDALIGADYSTGDANFVLVTNHGHIIKYHEKEVSVIGYRATGVKAMNLEKDETVQAMIAINKGNHFNVAALSDKGACKIFNPSSLTLTSRLAKPTELYKFYKSEPQYIVSLSLFDPEKKYYVLSSLNGVREITFDSTKATPIGSSLKNTIATQRGEKYITTSDMLIVNINNKTPIYSISEEEVKKEEKIEETKEVEKQPTIFDLIDDL